MKGVEAAIRKALEGPKGKDPRERERVYESVRKALADGLAAKGLSDTEKGASQSRALDRLIESIENEYWAEPPPPDLGFALDFETPEPPTADLTDPAPSEPAPQQQAAPRQQPRRAAATQRREPANRPARAPVRRDPQVVARRAAHAGAVPVASEPAFETDPTEPVELPRRHRQPPPVVPVPEVAFDDERAGDESDAGEPPAVQPVHGLERQEQEGPALHTGRARPEPVPDDLPSTPDPDPELQLEPEQLQLTDLDDPVDVQDDEAFPAPADGEMPPPQSDPQIQVDMPEARQIEPDEVFAPAEPETHQEPSAAPDPGAVADFSEEIVAGLQQLSASERREPQFDPLPPIPPHADPKQDQQHRSEPAFTDVDPDLRAELPTSDEPDQRTHLPGAEMRGRQAGTDARSAHQRGRRSRAPREPRRRPIYSMILVFALTIAFVGIGAIWLMISGAFQSPEQRDTSVPNPPATVNSEDYAGLPAPDGAFSGDWTDLFTPDDVSSVSVGPAAEATLVDTGGGVLRVVSRDADVDGEVLFEIGPGLLQTLSGGRALVAMTMRSADETATQIYIGCRLAGGEDCGRYRFDVSYEPGDVIFSLDLSDGSPQPRYLAINSDISGAGTGVDIYGIRIRPE